MLINMPILEIHITIKMIHQDPVPSSKSLVHDVCERGGGWFGTRPHNNHKQLQGTNCASVVCTSTRHPTISSQQHMLEGRKHPTVRNDDPSCVFHKIMCTSKKEFRSINRNVYLCHKARKYYLQAIFA